MSADPSARRDVVEVLLEGHTDARHVASLASALAGCNATSGAQVTARELSDRLQWVLPLHCEDEDVSIAPRLRGRHHRIDVALDELKLQHLSLEAPLARLRLLCGAVARDVSRLHALRFELASAAEDLTRRLAAHHAFEESAVFPALKRLLYADELESIAGEMQARRVAAAA